MENDSLSIVGITAALPYIQKYSGKIVVVKYGGNAMTSESLKKAVMSDIVLLAQLGIKVVLVHGGGPDITSTMNALGLEAKFINGLRYTDEATIDVVQMVLCGKTNKNLVKLVDNFGGKAIGLSGLDGAMIKAKKIDKGVDLGFVGDITAINSQPILDVMDKGYIPVIAAVGVDENNQVYNINADTAAAAIAVELKAESIILMTDIKGLMHDPDDDSSLISDAGIADLEEYIESGVVKGGMIPKVRCCMDVVNSGVPKAFMIDGRVEHSILIKMLSEESIGTEIHE